MNKFIETILTGKILISDGALGTELQKRGIASGACLDELNVSNPELVKSIYNGYFLAGSDIITANTFGANRVRLKRFGFENRVDEFNKKSVELAKEICSNKKFISADIGPTGKILEPLGEISESEAYNCFKEQAIALQNSEVDVIFIETMMDLNEIAIAIKAIKENTKIPVVASMTFEKTNDGFKTSWGVDIKSAVKLFEELDVDVMGSNCGNGFDEMVLIMNEFRSLTNKPLIAQPNAGIPKIINNKIVYNQTAESVIDKVEELINLKINVIGGCCGTNPDFINMMRKVLDNKSVNL